MKPQPFTIAYEDNHLIIVSKDSGVLVQGDRTGDKTLMDHVKEYIKEKYEKPGAVFLGCIHRIDRPVSGLVAFAKTSKGLDRMNELLRKKKLYKTYWAVVKNHPPQKQGKLTNWLVKDPKKNTVEAFDEEVEGSQKAELTYKVMGKLNDHFLLEVKPITGRPHQIRVQLATAGSPIRGDVKYGFPKGNPNRRSINLHARRLDFEHPVKKEPIMVIGGLPNDQFWEQFLVLDELKNRHVNRIIGNEYNQA